MMPASIHAPSGAIHALYDGDMLLRGASLFFYGFKTARGIALSNTPRICAAPVQKNSPPGNLFDQRHINHPVFYGFCRSQEGSVRFPLADFVIMPFAVAYLTA